MSDVKNHSTLTTNLVSYWELEEASGTRVDSHGSNDLTDNNTVGQTTGIQGNAASMTDANAEYLSITNAAQTGLNITGNLSMAFWFRPRDQGLHMMISKYTDVGSQRGYQCSWNAGTFALNISANGTNASNTTWSYALTNNVWYHVVFTFTASSGLGELWVDGSSQGTVATSRTSIYNSTDTFRIGANRYVSTGNCNDADFDEVGIWSKVLSSGEIADLYNSGSGIPYEAAGGGGFPYSQAVVIA